MKTKKNDLQYHFKTSESVLQKCKIVYLVNYHHYSINGTSASFPKEQYAEFVDPNPAIARRKAFEFAKSAATFPKNKLNELSVRTNEKSKSNGSDSQEPGFFWRWCNISCIEYGTVNNFLVYSELQNKRMPAFLENLAKEYDLFKRLGFDDRIFSRDVKDRNGKTYEVIYQNFSPNCNPAKDEPKSVTEDTEVSVQTNAFRTNYNINARLNDEVAMQLHYIIINFLRERYLSAKAA